MDTLLLYEDDDESRVVTRHQDFPVVNIVLARSENRIGDIFELILNNGEKALIENNKRNLDAARIVQENLVRVPLYLVNNISKKDYLKLVVYGDVRLVIEGNDGSLTDGEIVLPMKYTDELGIYKESEENAIVEGDK